jgi:hypothetical protein
MERRSFKQTAISGAHLLREAEKIRLKAESLPHGTEREELLTRARQRYTAEHIDEWLNSPGLQPPR